MGLGAQLLAQAGAELAPEVGHFGLNIPVRENCDRKNRNNESKSQPIVLRDSLPLLWSRMKTSMTIVLKLFAIVTQPFLGVQFQVDASPGTRKISILRWIFRIDWCKIHESRRKGMKKTRNCFSLMETYQDISLLAAVKYLKTQCKRMRECSCPLLGRRKCYYQATDRVVVSKLKLDALKNGSSFLYRVLCSLALRINDFESLVSIGRNC